MNHRRGDVAGILVPAAFALKALDAAQHSHQPGELAAAGFAPDADAVRVDAVARGVGLQEAHSAFRIMDLRGERLDLREAIVDACDEIAAFYQREEGFFRARNARDLLLGEAAAVHPDDGGTRRRGRRQIKAVHQKRDIPALSVFNALEHGDAVRGEIDNLRSVSFRHKNSSPFRSFLILL